MSADEFLDRAVHPFSDLRDTGLLWLINRVVFHPRGYALALQWNEDTNGDKAAGGWQLFGDGSEPWSFAGDEDEKFAQVEAFLREHAKAVKDDT